MDGTIEAMDRTSIQVSDELADELWDRKNRGESYEDVIWRLIERGDGAGREPDIEDESNGSDRDPRPQEHAAPEPPEPDVDSGIDAVVAHVSDDWSDTDERLAARRAAANAALQHAVETGEAVGKSDALELFYDEYAVDGQNEETWWRKNIRPVLKAVGEYSKGEHGYVVDDLGE